MTNMFYVACVALFVLAAGGFFVGVVFNSTQKYIIDRRTTALLTPTQGITLPRKCAPFYLDGTDKWITCMGVGKK